MRRREPQNCFCETVLRRFLRPCGDSYAHQESFLIDTERLDHFQDVIQLTHPQIIIQEADYYYDVDTFNACEQNGTLLLTLDAWAEVHPSLVTLPVDWDYTVPYGILYAKEPTDEVTRFLQILHTDFAQHPACVDRSVGLFCLQPPNF